MKNVVIATGLIGLLLAPHAAFADPPSEHVQTCQAVPAGTPGITVLGKRVPAISNIQVCVTSDTIAEVVPVVTNQAACGSPCFTVEIAGLNVEETLALKIDLSLDGQMQEIALNPATIGVDPANSGRLCVIGVGTPDPCTDRVLPPTNLAAAPGRRGKAGQVALNWSPATSTQSTIAGYQIWRSSSNEPGTFEAVGTSTSTSFVDTGLNKGASYWYYVVAWDGNGNYSPASNTASARSN